MALWKGLHAGIFDVVATVTWLSAGNSSDAVHWLEIADRDATLRPFTPRRPQSHLMQARVGPFGKRSMTSLP